MSKKTTIWIINQYASTPETGMGGRHYYLAQEFAQMGYKVYVIAASYTHILRNPKQLSSDYLMENLEPNFCFVWLKMPHYTKSTDKRRVLNWFEFAWKLTKLNTIIKEKPDVILYSSLSLIGYLGAERLAKKNQVPLVFEVRDIWPLSMMELGNYSPTHPFVRLLQWTEDRAYRNADQVISNLKNSVAHMVSRGLDPNKFSWVPNGYSEKEILEKEDLSSEFRQLVPNNKFIIGYTGSIGTANCLQNLIEAAHQLRENDKLCFVIVGHGEHKDSLVQYAQQLALNNVIFIPPIPKKQIPNMLSLFDVCYIGLTKDPLFRFGVSPNKLFDYLCAGKPILYAIDSGEYRPIEDAKAGYQIAPENTEELVYYIQKISELSKEELDNMGNNAEQYAKTYHNYHKIAQKLEKILLSVL